MAKANALSSVFVKQCRAPGVYRDGQGLMLRIEKSGAKRWVLRVTVRGRRRDIGLGSANSISLADVRGKAFEFRKLAREGHDPIALRREAHAVIPTFAEAAAAVYQQRLSEITTADILNVLTPIWLTKSETARRVRQRIHVVLEWAMVAGHRDGSNPAVAVGAGLPKTRDRSRHFSAMPFEQLPTFMEDLQTCGATEAVSLALRFLILTAARTGEVLGATWPEIDFEDATWTVSADRMKARRLHRVPLSSQALGILKQARMLQPSSNYLFPSRRGKQLSNMAMAMILRRLDRTETVHGFRSSFRDWAAETTNFPRDVCEAALAHMVESKTERAYRRTDLFEKRRELMDAWADFATKMSVSLQKGSKQ